MVLDFLDPISAETLVGISAEERLDERLAVGGETVGEHQGALLDVLEELVLRVRVVGGDADDQLVEQHAQQVPVHHATVSDAVQHLRGQVRQTPAERPAHVVPHALLRQSEVRQQGVPVLIQHHVLRLQVPEHDVLLVQSLQGQKHLAHVHARLSLLHPFVVSQQFVYLFK